MQERLGREMKLAAGMGARTWALPRGAPWDERRLEAGAGGGAAGRPRAKLLSLFVGSQCTSRYFPFSLRLSDLPLAEQQAGCPQELAGAMRLGAALQ